MALEILKGGREAWERVEKLEPADDMKLLKVRNIVKGVLDNLKDNKRETYDDVITKLVVKHGMLEGDIPRNILQTLDARIKNINQGKVHSIADAKEKVFSNEREV